MFLKSVTLLSCSVALASPEYASTVAGNVSLSQKPQLLEVTASDRAIVEWNRFSIDAGETVRFIQPTSNAAVLNRVVGQELSQIFGTLEGNGAVYLINPRGILVGETGVIDTAAFLASTLDCSNRDFLDGIDLSLQGDSDAPLTHLGTIRTKAGDVILVSHRIDHQGPISAPQGSVSLNAGHALLLKPKAFPLLNIRKDLRACGVSAEGSIEALNVSLQSDSLTLSALQQSGEITLTQEGGKILLSSEGGPIYIQETAKLTAPSGEITLHLTPQEGDEKPLYQLGTLDVSGTRGGTIRIEAPKLLNTGKLNADGVKEGGTVSISVLEALIETRVAASSANGELQGGTITLEARRLFTSGSFEAKGAKGGSIHVLGPDVVLAGAKLNATGHKESGGNIRIGHQTQEGHLRASPAQSLLISPSTRMYTAGYLQNGTLSIWSPKQEKFLNRLQDALDYPKQPLFDVSNLESTSEYNQFPLVDPDAGYGSGFGNFIRPLSTGNIVVTKPSDSFAATSAGAVYLYDGTHGDLISMITGSQASDQVGFGGAKDLTGNGNSNYVIASRTWANGAATTAGAATWASGTTGVSGTVSAANSLVGTSTADLVSIAGATFYSTRMNIGIATLSNGNYLVLSPCWDNGPVTDVGAVTWANGTTGITGTVSIINSLIGSTAGDSVGGVAAFLAGTPWTQGLPINGNYVVQSYSWNRVDGGAVSQVGAVTWGDGTTGITGTVSVTNSLIGSSANDNIAIGGYALPNGNVLARSAYWDRIDGGVAANVGAVIFINGTTGLTGTVSVTNALIGSTAGDLVGYSLNGAPPTVLTNNNYVVTSLYWNRVDGGVVPDVGAYTWGSGTTGITGTVSVTNSLIGSTEDDSFLGRVTTLTNGNYVINVSKWARIDGGVCTFVGAVPWGNGTTGITGTISITNSLIGFTTLDQVGFLLCALNNGNYVAGSSIWDRFDGGALDGVGAAAWGDGTTGITGTVSITNALIGFTAGDAVGRTVTALLNGNYLVASQQWDRFDGGAVADVGAVTWGNGTTGITGTVSIINSLIGSTANDLVGNPRPTVLPNGNYVVGTSNWDRVDGGAVAGVGAATWGSGTTGITGTVSVTNSLIGSTASDAVGATITTLPNSNYLVISTGWDRVVGGAVAGVGAVTWGNGTTGITGTVSVTNSLIGSTLNDNVGSGIALGALMTLPSGNYVIASPSWDRVDGGALTDCGAATWGSGTAGITGTVSQINSVIGPSASSTLQLPTQNLAIGDSFICPFQAAGSVIIGGIGAQNMPPLPYNAFIFAPTLVFNDSFPLWIPGGWLSYRDALFMGMSDWGASSTPWRKSASEIY